MDNIINSYFLNLKKKRNISDGTRDVYKQSCNQFLLFLSERNKEIQNTKREEISNYLKWLKDKGLKNSSINIQISALRNLFLYLSENEKIDNPMVETLYMKKSKRRFELSASSIKKIIKFLEHDQKIDLTSRLFGLFMIFLEMKGADVSKIKINDIIEQDNDILLIRKDKKERLSKLNPKIVSYLTEYMTYRRGVDAEFDELFLNSQNKPISRVNNAYIINRITKDLDLPEKSALILSKALGILREKRIINERYEIVKLRQEDSTYSSYEARDIEKNDMPLLLYIYSIDQNILRNIERLRIDLNYVKSIRHRNLSFIYDYEIINIDGVTRLLIAREYLNHESILSFVTHIKDNQVLEILDGLLSAASYITNNKLLFTQFESTNIAIVEQNGILIPKLIMWNLHSTIFVNAHRSNSETNLKNAKITPESMILTNIFKIIFFLQTGTINSEENKSAKSISKLGHPLEELLLKIQNTDKDLTIAEALHWARTKQPKGDSKNLEKISLDFDISKELNILTNSIRSLENDNNKPSFLFIKGDNGAGKSYLLNELKGISELLGISHTSIDLANNQSASAILSIGHYKKDEPLDQDYDPEPKRVMLFEKAFLGIKTDRAVLYTIDNLHLASPEFIELLNYIVERSIRFNSTILFAFAFNQEKITSNFIDPREREVFEIEIDKLQPAEINEIFKNNFNASLNPDVLDYIHLKANGVRGATINLIEYLLQSGHLIDSRTSITFTPSFYDENFESLPKVDDAENFLLMILAAVLVPIHFDFLKEILSGLEYKIPNLEQLINSLSENEIKILIKKDSGIGFRNKYLQGLYYKKLSSPLLENVEFIIASALERNSAELTHELLNRIAHHFYRAQNSDKSYYYLSKLAKDSRDNGFLNDAISYYNKIDKFYLSLSNDKKIELVSNKVITLTLLGKLKEANEELENKEEIFKKPKDNIYLKFLQVKIKVRGGEFEDALKILDKIPQNAFGEITSELSFDIQLAKLSVLFSLSSFIEIIREREKILGHVWDDRFIIYNARFLNLIALSHYYMANFTEALNLFKEAFSCARTSRGLRLKILNNMGMVYYRMCNFNDATRCYEEALQQVQDQSDRINTAIMINNLGAINHHRGRFFDALSLFEKAHVAYSEFPDTLGLEKILFAMAFIYFHIGLFERSENLLAESIKRAEGRKNIILVAYISALKGDHAKVKKNYTEAIQHYKKSEEIFIKYRLNKELCQIQITLTEVYLEMGYIDEAILALNNAKKIEKITNYSDISMRMLLCEISFHLKEQKIYYSGIKEELNKIGENKILEDDWELRLKYHCLRLKFFELVNDEKGLKKTVLTIYRGMKKIIQGCPREYEKSFFENSEFGYCIHNYKDFLQEHVDGNKPYSSKKGLPSAIDEESEPALKKRRFYLNLYEGKLKFDYSEIIGRSERMNKLLKMLDTITDSDLPVLITGESGTGKELIARAIHFNSKRKNKPLICENCAAFSSNLLGSELFGFKRGAFTDAGDDRRGIFEMADGGTIFLDEISEMSEEMQTKLLRVLETKEVRRIGDDKPRKIDVRIITASVKNIKKMVDDGRLRKDLFYRIAGVEIDVPPLRDRREDIPGLIKHFVKKINEKGGTAYTIDDELIGTLKKCDWPGNVRELKNKINRLIVLCEGNHLSINLLD